MSKLSEIAARNVVTARAAKRNKAAESACHRDRAYLLDLVRRMRPWLLEFTPEERALMRLETVAEIDALLEETKED